MLLDTDFDATDDVRCWGHSLYVACISTAGEFC